MKPVTDTQQRILDSARELIFSRSYADIGVAEICTHAGVKKGSFYHFFPSKRDLTLAVLDAYYLLLKEKIIDRAFDDDMSPLARLARFTELIYQFQAQVKTGTGHVMGCPFGNLSTELSTQEESIRAKIHHVFGKLQTQIRHVLQDGQLVGEIANNVDVAATAKAMFAYFEGVMLLSKNQNDPELVRDLLPTITSIRVIQS